LKQKLIIVIMCQLVLDGLILGRHSFSNYTLCEMWNYLKGKMIKNQTCLLMILKNSYLFR
jgi:hypothetical protein